MLGLKPEEVMDDDAESPFSSNTRDDPAKSMVLRRAPRCLQPTDRQWAMPHHPWIDVLPFPQMRDNLLQRYVEDTETGALIATFDEEKLCRWMIGVDPEQKEGGFILWGNPWELSSWEVTEDFIRHWGWSLNGCEGLIKSSNYWRRRRGEKAMFKNS